MKITAASLLTTTVLGIATVATGQTPNSSTTPGSLPLLKAGVQIRAANKALTVGHTASPEVLDWNNDGKKDLIVGTFSNGKVMLFLNRGTDAAPQFDQGRALQAGGKDISVGFG